MLRSCCICHSSTFSWSLSSTAHWGEGDGSVGFGVDVVGFNGSRNENPKGFFEVEVYLEFVVLHHDVLHAYLDMVTCFFNDDWAESIGPFWVVDRLQHVVGRF